MVHDLRRAAGEHRRHDEVEAVGEDRGCSARGPRPPPSARGRARRPGSAPPSRMKPRVRRESRSGCGIVARLVVDAAQVAREEVAEHRAPVEARARRPRARASAAGRRCPRARRAARRRAASPSPAGRCGRSRSAACPGSRAAASANDSPAVADRVVEARAVGHAARDRAPGREPVPRLDHRRGRHAAALRLEPEQPAAGGRDADRAAAVGAERRRAQARPRRPPPSRRWSRPACAAGPTGCG